jgi:SAM-dependent methyltransferase
MPETVIKPAHPIAFDPFLAEREVGESVKVWAGAIRAFARKLSPLARAEFFMALDSALYEDHGTSAIGAGTHGGLHPKHALTRYHDFFVENIGAGESVIDLGCGVGALACSIAQRTGVHVTGVDWAPVNLAKARTAGSALNLDNQLRFVEGDITSHREPRRFDVVVLSNVLEHLNERARLLARWGEWYEPKRFLIRVPAYDRDWRVPWKEELSVEWRLDPTHMTEYTWESLCEELRSAGLRTAKLTVRWGEYWVVAERGRM